MYISVRHLTNSHPAVSVRAAHQDICLYVQREWLVHMLDVTEEEMVDPTRP